MNLNTHFDHSGDLELEQLSYHQFEQLPWVNPDHLPFEAELQVVKWENEIGVVYLGDFGYYRCLPVKNFMMVVSLLWTRFEESKKKTAIHLLN